MLLQHRRFFVTCCVSTSLFLLVTTLVGCENDEVPMQQTPKVMSFSGKFSIDSAMNSQFGQKNEALGWRYEKAKLRPIEAKGDNTWLEDWSDKDIALNAQAFYLFDSTHAVILADGQELDNNDELVVAHASPGLVVALYFRLEKGLWLLDGEPFAVTAVGSMGKAGTIKLVDEVGEKTAGFTVESGGTWQGYTVNNIDIFALHRRGIEGLTNAGESIATDYFSCEESPDDWKNKGIQVPWLETKPDTKVDNNHKHKEEEEDFEHGGICHNFETQWHFEKAEDPQHFDVILNIKETAQDSRGEASQHAPIINISTNTARYRWKNNGYHLVDGKNPIPGI